MIKIEKEIDGYLTLLRNKIAQQGFTQYEIQETLGWGTSYLSQLLTKQKALRMDQVLSILLVIGVEPEAFFAELYAPRADVYRKPPVVSEGPRRELEKLSKLLEGLAELLHKKALFTGDELIKAVDTAAEDGQRFRG